MDLEAELDADFAEQEEEAEEELVLKSICSMDFKGIHKIDNGM